MGWLRTLFGGLAMVALLAAAAAQAMGTPRLGELWFRLDSASLNLTQAIIQRYLHPGLWEHVAVPLLLAPVAAVALGLAAIMGLLAWLLRRRR